jgi:hypothetical protein
LQDGLEGIVSKRKDSPYRSGRSFDWLKMKNPACAAVKREADEDCVPAQSLREFMSSIMRWRSALTASVLIGNSCLG